MEKISSILQSSTAICPKQHREKINVVIFNNHTQKFNHPAKSLGC